MAVRAKMRCTRRAECTSGGYAKDVSSVEVTLQAVYGNGDDAANAEWSKYTPSGELKLSITNADAYKQFEVGKAYFVDLTPAEG